MKSIDVVDCQIEQDGPKVHRHYAFFDVFRDNVKEFGNKRLANIVFLGGEFREGVLLGEEIEESLPIFE